MRQLMEGETKKRKITNIEDDNDDEDEEIKIEKFYALIRSAKDIRDQLLDVEGSSKGRAKKVVTTDKKADAVRVPRINEKSYTSVTTAEAEVAVVPNKADVRHTYQGAAAASAAASATGAGAAGSSAAGRISSSRISADEKSRITADQKNNYNRGRIFLDLNLSL